MKKNETKMSKLSEQPEVIEAADPEEIVFQIYKSYESLAEQHLWPWETMRWQELVFSLMTTIGEPDVSPETVREVTNALSGWRLLDIESLAGLSPAKNDKDAANPILVSVNTVLQQSGFTSEQANSAVVAMCDAAKGFKEKYEGKVQKYFRKYASLMLDELKDDFYFSKLDNEIVRRAFAIWLQNTLNMPVPVSDPITESVCEKLGIDYEAIIKAADDLDINIALLDDALRKYWEEELEGEKFQAAEEEK